MYLLNNWRNVDCELPSLVSRVLARLGHSDNQSTLVSDDPHFLNPTTGQTFAAFESRAPDGPLRLCGCRVLLTLVHSERGNPTRAGAIEISSMNAGRGWIDCTQGGKVPGNLTHYLQASISPGHPTSSPLQCRCPLWCSSSARGSSAMRDSERRVDRRRQGAETNAPGASPSSPCRSSPTPST